MIDESAAWSTRGRPPAWRIGVDGTMQATWLLVRWEGKEGRLPVNVVDSSQLPAPTALKEMSAEDMLRIIAASDPGGALRAWARSKDQEADYDPDLDSATPVDLDPLRRYSLGDTFLHRIRKRARLFQQLTERLSAPVHGMRALEWRLRGMIGVAAFADRLMDEMQGDQVHADEAVMSLADLLIALLDVKYEPSSGSLPQKEFEKVFRPFLAELMQRMDARVKEMEGSLGGNVRDFWRDVKKQVA